ncbi:hypothetical protein KUL118_25380 [Tenacibaculum sp. KUL118]|nr:hypothetical protein KUL118_25380 [Tenacibaculum sp. KUL118]
MQPFTFYDVQQNAKISGQSVEICLELPATPLKTHQWLAHFCMLFNFSASESDWGADRFQTILTTKSDDSGFQCMLCIEWLCEAIWLEPIGTQQSASTIFDYINTRPHR